MACRKINDRYANEGYIIKEIDLSDFLRQTDKILDFPKNGILIFAKVVKYLAWYSTSAAKEYTEVFPVWVARITAASCCVSIP